LLLGGWPAVGPQLLASPSGSPELLPCELVSTPVSWLLSLPPVIKIFPLLSGSGKLRTPCERIQAEYSCAFPALEAGFALLVVPTCATFAPDEPPPHAAASNDSPTPATSASPRNAVRSSRQRPPAACPLRSMIAISSHSQLTDLRV
jgi:hypothetical protein